MSEVEPRLVVERYVAEVLGGGSPARAAELIANPALRRHADSFRAAFPDARVEARQVLTEGDLVAVHLTGHGTHLGVFQGCPPTGRDWTAPCTAIYRTHSGRIADGWINWDWLAVMEQLGCIQRVETVSA
jgi:predicted ester cyclase